MVRHHELGFPLVLAGALAVCFVTHTAAAQTAPPAVAPVAPAPTRVAPAPVPVAPAPAPAPTAAKAPDGMAARFERSGDDWMMGQAYREAANAYEHAYELEPTDSLSHKLLEARARAGISLPSPYRRAAAPAPAPVPEADVPAERFRTHWYGYQPLLVDGGTLLLLIVSAAAGSGTGAGLTLIPYVVGGPTVHLVHGRYSTAGIDLGIRAGAPLVTGVIGFGIGALLGAGAGGNGNGSFISPELAGALIGGVLGFFGGIVGAVGVVAGLLSRERIPMTPPSALQWAPTVLPTRGGANVGVAGTF